MSQIRQNIDHILRGVDVDLIEETIAGLIPEKDDFVSMALDNGFKIHGRNTIYDDDGSIKSDHYFLKRKNHQVTYDHVSKYVGVADFRQPEAKLCFADIPLSWSEFINLWNKIPGVDKVKARLTKV